MADVTTDFSNSSHDECNIRHVMELFFYAYRDFTAEPDAILARYGLGRAHHRVLYFVRRNPGITVSQLLSILRITKQSLSRVLGGLVKQGYIEQTPGEKDRRQRLLFLTLKGRRLEQSLFEVQKQRVETALAAGGPSAAEMFRAVLHHMIDGGPMAGPDSGISRE